MIPWNEMTGEHFTVTHEVQPGQSGLRLDAFLKDRYKRRSRGQIQRSIDEGAIRVTRQNTGAFPLGRLRASLQLLLGDEVHVLSERKPEPQVDFGYQVLFEDEHLFVINKPGNLPVHPAGRYFFHTLLIHLRTRGFTQPLRADREYYLVHRIDRETSGVLVLTKTYEACVSVVAQFAKRQTQKKYIAVAHGVPERESFEVSAPMARADSKPIGAREAASRIRLKMAVTPVDEGGQTAQTQFRVLKSFERAGKRYSLVECLPKTGRQHQIRVHLAHAGHPIVGDKLYSLSEPEALRFFEPASRTGAGGKAHADSEFIPRYVPAELEAKLVLPRHALHAAALAFTHPITGQRLEFEAPLPPDLRDFTAST